MDKTNPSSPFSSLDILRQSIKAVPPVKFALGVAGVAAAAALAAAFFSHRIDAVFGIIIMFGLMVVLVVFGNLVRIASSFKLLTGLLAWASVLLSIATSFFIFTGFFFNWPRTLPSFDQPVLTSTPTPSITPTLTPIQTLNSTTPPSPIGASDERNQIKVWVNTDPKSPSPTYHCPGSYWYKKKTKHGKYMTQKEALEKGYHPARDKMCQ